MTSLQQRGRPDGLSSTADLAVARNAGGGIHVSPVLLAVVPPDVAWLGIQELHDLSLGTSRRTGLSEYDAWGRYGSAVSAVLGQVAVTDATAGATMLGSLCDYVDFRGSMDGLEGIFVSALGSAMRAGEGPETGYAADLLAGVGIPRVLGGGADTAAILDAAGQRMTTAGFDQLSRAFGGNTHGGPELLRGLAGLFGTDVDSGQLGSAADRVRDTGLGTAAGGALGRHFAGREGGWIGSEIGHAVEGFVSDVLSAIGDFLSGIFGSSEGHASASAQQATVGTGVVVDKVTTTDRENRTQVVGPDGTVTTSHTTEHITEHSSERKCPQPAKPDRCQVDDGGADPDFQVSYWRDNAVLSPGLVAFGGGVDALTTVLRSGALRLEGLPALDPYGEVASGGFLDDILVPVHDARAATPTWRTEVPADALVRGALEVIRTAPAEYVVQCAVEAVLTGLARGAVPRKDFVAPRFRRGTTGRGSW